MLRWVPRLFLGIGVVLLVAAAVTSVLELRFLARAERAPGTVIDVSRHTDSEGTVTFRPVVRFTIETGETIEFVSSSGSSVASKSVGDQVEVLYDPDDPKDAELSDFFSVWGFPVILGGLGVVFTAVSAFAIRITRRPSKADAAWLRAHGVRVQGRSPRSVLDGKLTVQGRSPFRVEVDVHDAARNEMRVLTSEAVWFDPAPYLESRDVLDVYVDPNRPERYLVDVSFLPRLVDS